MIKYIWNMKLVSFFSGSGGLDLGFEKSGFEIIDMKDTHLRFHFLCRIPILREFLIPAVAFIVKK